MKIKTQPDNYSCGIYSIINALMILGEKKTPKEIKELTGTTKQGTSEKGIINALNSFGYVYRRYNSHNKNNAWRWVLDNSIHNPLILYLDTDHWAVIAGRVRNKVILLDSWDTAHVLNKKELLERWSNNSWYWGLRIGK